MPVTRNGEEYVSVREAAEMAGRGSEAIRRWIASHWVEGYQDGARRWWVKKTSLEAFLADHSKSTPLARFDG